MGGHFEHPCYLDVLSRITYHAEVCQVKYDPSMVEYRVLLDVFWNIHDPTSLNRQGADRGEQYRSVIFFYTQQQETIARRAKENLERLGKYDKAIVTSFQPASTYWIADEYHQQYFHKLG